MENVKRMIWQVQPKCMYESITYVDGASTEREI